MGIFFFIFEIYQWLLHFPPRLILESLSFPSFLFLFLFFLIYFIDFTQRGIERDRELETSMREKHRPAASCTPSTGDVPAAKVCALDRNRTRDPSASGSTLYPLSQTGFGSIFSFSFFFFFKYILLILHREELRGIES